MRKLAAVAVAASLFAGVALAGQNGFSTPVSLAQVQAALASVQSSLSATQADTAALKAAAPSVTQNTSDVSALKSGLASAQSAIASAQSAVSSLSAQLSSLATAVSGWQSDYAGSTTLAKLAQMSPAQYDGKRVLVTDLGGGAAYVRASAQFSCWRRVATTTSVVQPVAVSATAAVDGLASSPVVLLTGSAFASRAALVVTNGCSMPQLTVVVPSGVIGVAGSLGLSASGGSALSVAGVGVSGIWGDYAVSPDGSSVTKLRGGSL